MAIDYVANAGEIHRGVSVGDVALGGKTLAEAREILGRRVSGASGKIDLLVPGGSFTVHIKDLGARVDIGATVGEAYAVGRQGGVLGRLAGRVHALFGVSVPAEVRFRPDAARRKVESLVARADKEARNASVTVSGVRVKVIGSSEGYRLDVPATTENLHRALENLSGEAKVAGKILEPQITTAEAEAVAGKVREATSVPLVLGAEGERWKISPSEVGSALEVAENAGRLS
ncbi:MAG TPA: peptidoglycan binding domain-containing protein, partial [Rubrobacter sp.]|nr:peptidoglycan binding domain-containing protein [Rubrobacter sp.]